MPRLHAACREKDGGLPPDAVVQDHDEILADTERLVALHHDRSPGAMVRIVAGAVPPFRWRPEQMQASAELAEKLDVRCTRTSREDPDEDRVAREVRLQPVDWFESVGWASATARGSRTASSSNDERDRAARAGGDGRRALPEHLTCLISAAGSPPVARCGPRACTSASAVDGAGSEHASMWLEAHTALLLGRLRDGADDDGRARRAGDGDARLGALPRPRGARTASSRRARAAISSPGRSRGSASPARWSDPVEAWLRCGPVAPRHTVVAGKPVVRDSALAVPGLDEMLKRHAAISREWQDAAA